MKSTLLAQQKQDNYIKQLASEVDVLTTHNKMLEAKIAQQASCFPTPPTNFLVRSNLSLGEYTMPLS